MHASSDLGRPVEGVLWMLATTLAFVGVNGIVRHLGTELPAAQSAFIRFAFGLVFLAPALWGVRGTKLADGIWPLFLWRGALHVAAVIFWFWAMARVPVAEMAAIGFLNPVVVLIIAGLLLGEGGFAEPKPPSCPRGSPRPNITRRSRIKNKTARSIQRLFVSQRRAWLAEGVTRQFHSDITNGNQRGSRPALQGSF